jgi:diaminopimelate epimerase
MSAEARPFVKMHGLGNDFVIFDGRADGFVPDSRLAAWVADRHFGVGCDQVITLGPSARADLFMQKGDTRLSVETLAGVLPCVREPDGRITVDMGAPRLEWQDIPLSRPMDTLDVDFAVRSPAGFELRSPVAVSMGNPHAVFFVADADAIDLSTIGPVIEHDPLFPERVNVSVAEVRGRDRIRLRVWERGAGITLACGSAACATVVAATRRGLIDGAAAIEMDGGVLDLRWGEDDHVTMTGPAVLSFRGTLSLNGAAS